MTTPSSRWIQDSPRDHLPSAHAFVARTVMRWLNRRRATDRQAEYARVAPWLLIGPALEASEYATLVEAGVTHVLDLRSERSDDPELMESLGLEWRRVPIDDLLAPRAEQLTEIVDWLEAAPGEDPPMVYVHCQGGLGRAPTIAIALLMRRGFTRAEARRFVVTARSVAAPTAAQDAWLTELELKSSSRRLSTQGRL